MRWPIWRVAVAERSMEPALRPGDWLLVLRSPVLGSPVLGSPVLGSPVLGSPVLGSPVLGSPVSGRRGPGRAPRIRPGQIVIARHPGRPELLIVKRAVRREPAGWWLESDNPAAGAVDSSRFGAVPPGLIEGRVLLRYWPLRRNAESGRP
jgi:hypothetical protein